MTRRDRSGKPVGVARLSLKTTVYVTLLCAVIAVGNTANDGSDSLRFPGPYLVGSGSRSVTVDTILLGRWIKDNYGANTRIYGDIDTISDMHLYGQAWPLKGVPAWGFTFAGTDMGGATATAKAMNETLFIIDTRMVDGSPGRGYYYDVTEPGRGKQVVFDLTRLSNTTWATLVHKQGPYKVYEFNLDEMTSLSDSDIEKVRAAFPDLYFWLEEKYASQRNWK